MTIHPRRTARPAAVFGAAALLALLAGCSVPTIVDDAPPRDPVPSSAPEPEPVPESEPEEGDETNVFALAVGDCILDDTDEEEVTSVQVVDCASPHTFEVYHEFALPEGGYPADLDTQADDGCYAAFAGFMGVSYEESMYGYTWYSPTQESWDTRGDRLISCLVADPSEAPVTGSLRGSGL